MLRELDTARSDGLLNRDRPDHPARERAAVNETAVAKGAGGVEGGHERTGIHLTRAVRRGFERHRVSPGAPGPSDCRPHRHGVVLGREGVPRGSHADARGVTTGGATPATTSAPPASVRASGRIGTRQPDTPQTAPNAIRLTRIATAPDSGFNPRGQTSYTRYEIGVRDGFHYGTCIVPCMFCA
jgi:hypothetical protein